MVDYEFRQLLNKRMNQEEKFDFEGKVGRGTYGTVYKVKRRLINDGYEYALKVIEGTGLTQSVCRELSILREMSHKNVIKLTRVYLNIDHRLVSLLFPYAEHDLWHMIKYHRTARANNNPIEPLPNLVKGIMAQLLHGITYMHHNSIMHRDIKPANVLVMGEGPERGIVKIADLGFARTTCEPLKPLADIDPVVVTFWYRSPELLLGARHYSDEIDIWSIGCIFAELLTYEPLFHCRQEDIKTTTPYHKEQLERIFRVMGFPSEQAWPTMHYYPEYQQMRDDGINRQKFGRYTIDGYFVEKGFSVKPIEIHFLKQLLNFDPRYRISAHNALAHDYFADDYDYTDDIFNGAPIPYPKREFIVDEREENNHQHMLHQQANHRAIDTRKFMGLHQNQDIHCSQMCIPTQMMYDVSYLESNCYRNPQYHGILPPSGGVSQLQHQINNQGYLGNYQPTHQNPQKMYYQNIKVHVDEYYPANNSTLPQQQHHEYLGSSECFPVSNATFIHNYQRQQHSTSQTSLYKLQTQSRATAATTSRDIISQNITKPTTSVSHVPLTSNVLVCSSKVNTTRALLSNNANSTISSLKSRREEPRKTTNTNTGNFEFNDNLLKDVNLNNSQTEEQGFLQFTEDLKKHENMPCPPQYERLTQSKSNWATSTTAAPHNRQRRALESFPLQIQKTANNNASNWPEIYLEMSNPSQLHNNSLIQPSISGIAPSSDTSNQIHKKGRSSSVHLKNNNLT